jgi:hypothetical protein
MSNARKKKKGDGILRTLFKGGHRLDHRGRVGGWGGVGDTTLKGAREKRLEGGGGRTDKFFSEIKNQKLIQ